METFSSDWLPDYPAYGLRLAARGSRWPRLKACTVRIRIAVVIGLSRREAAYIGTDHFSVSSGQIECDNEKAGPNGAPADGRGRTPRSNIHGETAFGCQIQFPPVIGK